MKLCKNPETLKKKKIDVFDVTKKIFQCSKRKQVRNYPRGKITLFQFSSIFTTDFGKKIAVCNAIEFYFSNG